MLRLDILHLFCDLVDTGSFSRTAEKNFVSQSAVSQTLRALEREMGQTLLIRGQGRGAVRPTDAGKLLYAGAQTLLRDAQNLEANLRGLSGEDDPAGTVRVATVYSVGLHALPPRLKPFLAAHPRINVHLEYRQTEAVYADVAAGRVDIGIVACPTAKRGIEVVPFGNEDMVLVCAPESAFAGAAQLPLSQLNGAAFVGFDTDIPTRRLIDERLRASGARVRMVSTYDNIETIKNLVEIGSGVSLVPADTVVQEARAGTLTAVPLVPADRFRRPTGLLLKKAGTRSAAVRAFVDAMRQTETLMPEP